MKKIFALLCAIIITTALFSCNKNNNSKTTDSFVTVATNTSVATNTTVTSVTTVATNTTATTTAPAVVTETQKDENGNITYIKHAYTDGKTAKEEFFAYDESNNITAQEETAYIYSASDFLIRISSYDVENGTKKLNNEITFTYNESGKLSAEEFYAMGESGALFLRDKTEYIYSESGALAGEIYRVYDESGALIYEDRK
jgi:hypothetical protein